MRYYWHRASLSKVQHVWNCEHYHGMLFCFLPLHNRILSCMAKKNLWRSNILGKLNYFCLTCVLVPLVDQSSLHLDNFCLEKCFQYNPTKMLLFDQIFHSYQGGVAQIQRQILQGRPYSFKRVLHAHNIPYVSLCAFCRVVVPTKPFTNTALYYKMLLESEPPPLPTKCFGGFDGGSKANVGHYKMHLRNHFVVKNGLQWKIMILY